MNPIMKRTVNKIRFLIYASPLITLAWINLGNAPKVYVPTLQPKEILSFWPPDLVPHPVVPGDGPVRPSTPPLSRSNQ